MKKLNYVPSQQLAKSSGAGGEGGGRSTLKYSKVK